MLCCLQSIDTYVGKGKLSICVLRQDPGLPVNIISNR